MTMHFSEFDAPAALEDDLAGCPVRKRIDAACEDPGCPNAAAGLQQAKIQLEDCIRPDERPAAARPLWQRSLADLPRPAGIYQTQPKDRCVM